MVFSARLINQDECAAGDSAVALKGSCSQGCACESVHVRVDGEVELEKMWGGQKLAAQGEDYMSYRAVMMLCDCPLFCAPPALCSLGCSRRPWALL